MLSTTPCMYKTNLGTISATDSARPVGMFHHLHELSSRLRGSHLRLEDGGYGKRYGVRVTGKVLRVWRLAGHCQAPTNDGPSQPGLPVMHRC